MKWRVEEHQQFEKLSYALRKAEEFSRENDALVAQYLTNYGYIRATGYFENLLNKLVKDFVARENKSKEILRYFELQFRHSSTYDVDGLAKFLDKFDSNWHGQLLTHKDYILEGPWKTALEGLYNVRHHQAHGGVLNGNLSELKTYAKSLRALLLYIADNFFKPV